MRAIPFAAIALCVMHLSTAAQAKPEPDFYRGKNIRVVIPTAVGGSYGVFGQLVSRHLGRFIAGQPAMVMTAMPGAGGLVALNHMANVAPHDGTVISVIQVTLVQDSLFNKDAKFDARDFKWIGRMDSLAFVGLASRRSGI
jgi:tripartite-type tricarboxylate transporter receptor subunit TctC